MKREFVRYLQGHEKDTLAIATILQTHGSTPRKAGTTMVVHPDGSIFWYHRRRPGRKRNPFECLRGS